MGLDMYLTGRKFFWYAHPKETERREDGKRVSSMDVELGYWRKHPNLHGYFVNEFAKGDDNCQEIDLTANDLRKVIAAVERGALPHTTGFFFGASDGSPEEVQHDLDVLKGALAWLEESDESPVTPPEVSGVVGGVTAITFKPRDDRKAGQQVTRTVHYRASW